MKVVIVGAGGQARVVFDILSHDPTVDVVGFTDRAPPSTQETILGKPVLGSHDDLVAPGSLGVDHVIVAIGDNALRAAHFQRLRASGFHFATAVHPRAIVSRSATVGGGAVVGPGAIVGTAAHVGEDCIVNSGAIVEHEVRVADHAHVGPGAIVAGRTHVGARAFVGAGSVVREYVRVGDDVVVGAGSVVLEDLPDGVMAAGAPAVIRKRAGARVSTEAST